MAVATRALLLTAVLLAPVPGPARAVEPCPGAETTLAMRDCLAQRLEQRDRELAKALAGVARAARREPEISFRPRWRNFVDAHAGGQDPAVQLRSFQQARRQVCRYAHSISLQGSGYGLFVSDCEIDLSDALLRQFRN